VLGDTEDRNNVSGKWHNDWPLDIWVEFLIFRWLREPFLAILVKEPPEYSKPDQTDASRETLLPDERNENAPPCASPPLKAVQISPIPVQVRHLKWWLMMFFSDKVNIFHMYAEMGNNEHTEMQLKFQNS